MESYLNAEISASAVRHNMQLLRWHVGPDTKLCAVVKADCYGHGLETLWRVISGQADWLAVATPTEAITLRDLGYDGPLLMFFSACAYADGQEMREALDELIVRRITLTVVSAPEAEFAAEAAVRLGIPADVHVKIDTGMGRSGVWHADAPALIEQVRNREGLNLTGLYTHLAAADEADKGAARHQLDNFREAAGTCPTEGLMLHAANSAGTIDLPESHFDMVRPGIAVYGYQPSDEMQRRLELRPALRLTAMLMQAKELPAGSGVGYGLTYTFTEKARVGLVAVGYADGYMRCLTGKVSMRVRGADLPVRGRVAMDQVIVDLTGVPEARVGDEVEIISPDPAAPHSVENLARLAGTIPYEITCGLGRRVRRRLVE